MKNSFLYFKSFLFFCISAHLLEAGEIPSNEPVVVGSIFSQLGNNFFQVATTYAVAWDHGATPIFPGMLQRVDQPDNPQNTPLNYFHVFFRCNISNPSRPISKNWEEPSFSYHSIPYQPNMKLWGYFQSEKYFAHHRDRLLELFSPHPEDLFYMKEKYKWLFDHPYTVGIMVRKWYEDPSGKIYIQYGKDFVRKALAYFPGDPLFVVSSNNIQFAKENIPEEIRNVVFLEDEPHYIDLFLLSFCKHHIITNSTFGWWSAWLNQNTNQIVVTPRLWYNPTHPIDTKDLVPDRWVKIDAKGGALLDPNSYQ